MKLSTDNSPKSPLKSKTLLHSAKKTTENVNQQQKSPASEKFNSDAIWLHFPAEALKRVEYTPEMVARLVSVKNISLTTSIDDLHKYFGSFGKVEHIRISGIRPATGLQMANNLVKVSGVVHPIRETISATIIYEDADVAKIVANTDGLSLKGNHLVGMMKDKDVDLLNEKTLFVGLLGDHVVEEELWTLFGVYGLIKQIRVVANPFGKLHALITYVNSRSIELALHKRKIFKLGGFTLSVDKFKEKSGKVQENKTKVSDPVKVEEHTLEDDNEEDDEEESDAEVVPLKLESEEEDDDNDDDDEGDDEEDVSVVKKKSKGPKPIISKKKKEKTNPKKLILQQKAVATELVENKRNGANKGFAKKKVPK